MIISKKYIINNLAYIAFISSIIIEERIKTNASWLNIIKARFGTIVLLILIVIIVNVVMTIFKD